MNFLILQECQNQFLKDNNLVSLIKDNIKLINELDNKIIIDFKASINPRYS